jgi:hypothetical protein
MEKASSLCVQDTICHFNDNGLYGKMCVEVCGNCVGGWSQIW